MTVTTYQQVIETLYGLERGGGALGLHGIERLLDALGRPQERFRAVHVAGTNGKGSVCALTERILRAAGLRTGLFTSPHLMDYRERLRVGGRAIGEEALGRLLERVRALPEAVGRTFFEVTTALGFAHFVDAGVEWAVVEVGLGGRLDCTNVLRPQVCAVTEIGLDHTELLGPTLEDVAREKAGIIKPGVPVVAALRRRAAARVIAGVAGERDAPLVHAARRLRATDVQVGRDGSTFTLSGRPWGALGARIALRGPHQVRQAATAAAIAGVLRERGAAIEPRHVVEGLAAARWPGRLEPCPTEPRLWWDGAHNPDGLDALARAWPLLGLEPPGGVVFACSSDKPAPAMLRRLARFAPGATLYATQSSSERTQPAEALADAARAAGLHADARPDLEDAVREALRRSRPPVLLCGSLFAVGDAMRATGCPPLEAV